MFHISPPKPPFHTSDHRRSPLIPRTPNACPRYSAMMASQTKSATRRTPEERRHTTRGPQPSRKPEQARDLRRQAYLNKVREASDNKRWENRSDQILRQEYFAHQGEWQSKQATSAPERPPSPAEEELEDPEEEATMVDQILSLEDREFQALISSMNEMKENGNHPEAETHEHTASEYGSDEEEYDRLFRDVMISYPQQTSESQTQLQTETFTSGQDMDMSMG